MKGTLSRSLTDSDSAFAGTAQQGKTVIVSARLGLRLVTSFRFLITFLREWKLF